MLTVNQTNGQSFKAVNVVRVPERAFSNPADIQICARQVDKALGGSGSKFASILAAIKSLFGVKPKEKIMTDKIGLFKDAPAKEGYLTFSVITGADLDECLDKISLKKVMAFMREFNITDSKDAMASIINKIKWANNNKPSKEIMVDTLEQLKAYADKI